MSGGQGALFQGDDDGEIASAGGVERAPFVAQPSGRGGRRPGALNRKTLMLGKYLQAKGYRDPAVMLAEIANADPLELWRWIETEDKGGETSLLDVMKWQADAAKSLLPYLHAKITPDAVVDASTLPAFHLHLGNGPVADGQARGLSILDLVATGAPNEINGLDVRRDAAVNGAEAEGG